MLQIQLTFSSNEQPASVSLLTLTRADTGNAVSGVSLPAAFTDAGSGVWTFDFEAPAPGLHYDYTFRMTWEDESYTDAAGNLTDAVELGEPTTRAAGWEVITPPAQTPISLIQAKDHLRVSTTDEDDLIDTYIAAATDYAQDRLNACLIQQTIRATYYAGEPLYLPRGPLMSVTSVQDANEAALPYSIRHVGHRIEIVPTAALTYPVTVVYTAGYGSSPNDVPAAIRLAIRQHVASMYAQRESIADKPLAAVPQSLEDFYRLKARKVAVG